MRNGIMLQGFEWELPPGPWWKHLEKTAFRLHRQGFTAIWLPPACKGAAGAQDVGYGVYDLYDLGEFHQKGSLATKYGTRAEYMKALRSLQAAQIQTLADVVLNHRLGADGLEEAEVYVEDPEHRTLPDRPVRQANIYTRFDFAGRNGRYSVFQWDKTCFTGVDWDEAAGEKGLFRLKDKTWSQDVDDEKGNYDYLMGADVDVSCPKVAEELRAWGVWFAQQTGCDGFRLDAVKHISAAFYRGWLEHLRQATGRELFTVGEYWHADVHALLRYLDSVGESMSLFDVPLHHHMKEASVNPTYDMRNLFEGTLVGTRPHLAVTFVDNHDTQPGQSLESWVEEWFKPAAYALILLRSFGYPCVFWGDLHGIPARKIPPVKEVPQLLKLRRTHAYGEEHDYFDDPDVIGFTREGDDEHPFSGLAVLCTNAAGREKEMYVGKNHAGKEMRCVIGEGENVLISASGKGTFRVKERQICVYIPALESKDFWRKTKKDFETTLKNEKIRLRWLKKRFLSKPESNG